MNFDDIINSDDYLRGFNEGKDDALAGNNKHNWKVRFKASLSVKSAIHGSNAIRTYYQGYNAGYDTTMKSKIASEVSQTQPIRTEIINNSNNHIINSNMPQNQITRIQFQLELAEDLKSYLHGFQERLGVIADKYKNKYENLGNVMIPDFHEEFTENYENSIKIISDLVNQINENDIPHVERYIDWLESRW